MADDKIKTSEILPSLLGYEIDRRDRKTDPHGGVLIASKKDLQIHDINCAKNCELISGVIDLPNNLNFIFYWPPKESDSEYTENK